MLLVSPSMDSARNITDSSSCDAVRIAPAFSDFKQAEIDKDIFSTLGNRRRNHTEVQSLRDW